jgi:hypothetical protein
VSEQVTRQEEPPPEKTVRLKTRQDHLQRVVNRRSPFEAACELIWNALDADATRVSVLLHEDAIGGISVDVADDGHGFDEKVASRAFENLGASWKKGQRSPGGRALHGQAGEGRLSAFAIGAQVTWTSRALRRGKVEEVRVFGTCDNLASFKLSGPVSSLMFPGTTVAIRQVDATLRSLLADNVHVKVAEKFALYLRQHPTVAIDWNGTRVDPAVLVEHVEEITLPTVALKDGEESSVQLTVIEWNHSVRRELALCDAEGFCLRTTKTSVQAPGFNFTAYLKSERLRELHDENLLDFEDLNTGLQPLLEAAREGLRGYVRRRASSQAAGIVEEWKKEDVYPFDGNPQTPIEEVERQVFDAVASRVNEFLPEFSEAAKTTKKFSLRMLRSAIEQSPSALKRIIEEVLELPAQKREELVELLEKTSLTAIINASKEIVDRLDFLAGLEAVLFDSEHKKHLKERTHLHRLLAANPWIFGEEFHMSVDDQSLTEVLRKHLGKLGRDDPVDEGVKRLDGTTGIVDLMLSKKTAIAGAKEFEHLVVELKRPSQKIDQKVVNQIEGYAYAVARDERFRDSKVRWVFWAISNEMDDFARQKVTGQNDRPDGMLDSKSDPQMTIWVKTWGQVIDECRCRLQFYRERLEYMASQDEGLAHLRKQYPEHVPKSVQEEPSQPNGDTS